MTRLAISNRLRKVLLCIKKRKTSPLTISVATCLLFSIFFLSLFHRLFCLFFSEMSALVISECDSVLGIFFFLSFFHLVTLERWQPYWQSRVIVIIPVFNFLNNLYNEDVESEVVLCVFKILVDNNYYRCV